MRWKCIQGILLENFKHNRIIMLPQTIFMKIRIGGKAELVKSQKIYNDCKNLTIFAREKISYNFYERFV